MSARDTNKNKEMHSRLQDIPIAIIGMSAVFPESKNMQAYWDNIVREVDCIIDVPPSRWNIEDYYDPDPSKEDKTYCKRGGFIPDIDFDPMEFGLPPNILEVTDVHQLLSLVLAKEVLRDGGYSDASEELRQETGVILGVGGGQKAMIPLVSRLQYPIWERVLKNSGVSDSETNNIVATIKKAYVGWEENSFPGALGNVIAGRIANRLNLGGTNSVVDAACASSLSGIRMAISELLDYRAEMMITGGVDTDNSPYMYLCFSKTQAFTKNDKSKPFNVDSDGMIMGEGIGMLLLKRLEDAERDKDRIYAVIKGLGSSSDGRFKSIYAPRAEGQELALKRAYKDANIDPSTIELLEAHGTGTTAGDLAEVTALKDFFNRHDQVKQHIAMGSVKSQIGHTKNAAGAAGIIKVALALYHKILPASINITEPNKDLDLESSPFYLNTEVRPWIHNTTEYPRRAGLSAFGFGGTNFHFILEEYQRTPPLHYRLHFVPHAIILNAPDPLALLKRCEKTLKDLQAENRKEVFADLIQDQDSKELPLGDARVGFVVDSMDDTVSLLEKTITKLKEETDAESWELRNGIHYRKKGIDSKGKIVALFAGQGSPYLNMGKELIYNYPPLLENQAYMDKLFIEDNLPPLSQIIYPKPVFDKGELKSQEKQLQLTEHAQPAIGVFSAGQYQLLKNAGFKPDFTAGHSFGELTALWAAEVLSDDDYFKLAKARGKAMAAPNDPDFDAGSMLAVVGDIENLEDEIRQFEGVSIANFNSKNQVVIAGPTEQIKKAQEGLKDKYRAILLGVSAAFHTELVGHAQKPFAEVIETTKFNKPNCTVYSNASAKPYPQTPKSIKKTLQDHILNSVRFKQKIENIYEDGGFFFVEFGPQSILSKLVENILKGKPFVSVAFNANAKKSSEKQFREALVKLKVAGLQLGNIDPYEYIPKRKERNRRALTLKISGTNYVSEKTKRAFEEALQDRHIVQQPSAPQEPITSKTPVKTTMNEPEVKTEKKVSVQPQTGNLNYSIQNLERGLANFYHHQNETLRIHEQFLANQSEYSRSFFQIMQQQSQAGSNTLSKEVTQSITQFHSHQGDTLRIHEQYLKHQTEYSKHSFELLRQQQATLINGEAVDYPQVTIAESKPAFHSPPKPVEYVPTPVASPPVAQSRFESPTADVVKEQSVVETVSAPVSSPVAASSLSEELLASTLLNVVSEKTGYQADMLELNMDLEADLGIDSIKRVEILNGIQEQIPDLPQLNPEELAEMRTLRQIVDYMTQKSTQCAPVARKSVEPKVAGTTKTPSIDKDRLITVLLNVISEKTGYQSDMLDLEMDMEADLGIDSIKRVEILNGIQEQLPDLPQINPEELAELRTLKQIADHMINQSTPAHENVIKKDNTDTTLQSGINLDLITKTLLEVVSEKTGYLSDMLELGMDLEADLGIDSIKRVEILNGIQEKLPSLPEINPEELAELRTLEQIAQRMILAAKKDSAQESSVKKKQSTGTVASIAG
ncbi:acyltransferase domain-containing protein [bacterium]|nr:acyltransferase domain-containing protein [bacterium]